MIYNRRKILTHFLKSASIFAFALFANFSSASMIAGNSFLGKISFHHRLSVVYKFSSQKNIHGYYADLKSWENKYAFLDLMDDYQKKGLLSYTTKSFFENNSLERILLFKNGPAAKNFLSDLRSHNIIDLKLLAQSGCSLSLKLT